MFSVSSIDLSLLQSLDTQFNFVWLYVTWANTNSCATPRVRNHGKKVSQIILCKKWYFVPLLPRLFPDFFSFLPTFNASTIYEEKELVRGFRLHIFSWLKGVWYDSMLIKVNIIVSMVTLFCNLPVTKGWVNWPSYSKKKPLPQNDECTKNVLHTYQLRQPLSYFSPFLWRLPFT